ncbi:MAG: rhomboid family intramembrane serine protease [Planctomycetaceae bacterium]
MGIHNRDYVREDWSPTAARNWGERSVLQSLLIVNVVVFVMQNASPTVTDWLDLSLHDLQRFQIWRLLTYGFCHETSGLGHLVFNMIGLWLFGRVVEPIYGHREFLWFYLASIVASGICHIMFQLGSGEPFGVVGASGGVYAVTILAAIHYPRMTILFMMILPVELRWLAVFYIVSDVLGLVNGGSGIANAAHLGGAAFAALYYYNQWRISTWFSFRGFKFRLPRRSPKIKLHQPEPEENLDSKVDALLQKIHQQGEASLTDAERKLLKDASERYKNRR